jgi:CheY-like chemotaxis protein
MMGGELTLKSRTGQGSTFSLRLYLPGIAPDPRYPLPAALQMRSVTGYLGERKTLLVVDDQPLHRQLLAGILMPLGFVVQEAASGQECMEILEHKPPDVLLLDITMDDLDGWETARLVRQKLTSSTLPVVFVSANLFDNQPERLTELDCQAFVGKPVMESELLDALQKSLSIEWVRDLAPIAPPVSIVRDRVSGPPLPADLREELQRLARQGQVAALRQRLWLAQNNEPDHAATLALLLSCADRFDFQTLIEYIRDTAELSDDYTDQ